MKSYHSHFIAVVKFCHVFSSFLLLAHDNQFIDVDSISIIQLLLSTTMMPKKSNELKEQQSKISTTQQNGPAIRNNATTDVTVDYCKGRIWCA
jgi:hypothetical protein